MAAGSVLTLLCASVALLPAAEANAFLGLSEPGSDRDFPPLLDELESVLGREHKAKVEQGIDVLIASLRPTFQALPKTSEGMLEPAAVRYLLHRYFVDRHGWFVQGFESAGEAWNSSSPTALFGQHIGVSVQEMFEDRLAHRGMSLHEAAVLAATLESLVHSETIQRLHSAYRLAGLSQVEEHAKEIDVDLAMDTYMMMYVLGLNHSIMTPAHIEKTSAMIDRAYPNWSETKKWTREVRKEVLQAYPTSRGSFGTTTLILEEIGDRYGRWQDQECSQVKDTLVKLERLGSGRVPLARFYEAALNGSWFLSETRAYLRQIGALDETDPDQPSVIIPNYVNGNSNCVASSKFYAVCCISECEALLGHIEHIVASPTAEPSNIAKLVSQLPSATVDAPRALSENLLKRLDDVASHHGGKVPLHGRLFMQWLHHAYPRECPYPHLSGVSKPVTARQWKEQTGEQPTADAETMRWHIQESHAADVVANPVFEESYEVPWLAQEELFINHLPESKPQQQPITGILGRGLLLAAMASSMMLALMHMITKAGEAMAAVPQQKHSV